MSLYLGDIPIANDGSHRLTGEIGDMGFAPLGIDESLNLRRYLNGQVISQSLSPSFTAKVKQAIALFSNLGTTESNWQSEKTLSKLGQCGKFVVDDTEGTIRLPAVVNAQGLLSLSAIGTIKDESLPNPYSSSRMIGLNSPNGAASLSPGIDYSILNVSSTYQDNAPVQQEAIQYPYYIQIATGVEETLPAIREYKVNNSDYFGKSMYSDIAPNNASWLISNNQYNARTVYPDYYDWLVERMNAGISGFVDSTATYTDYDFVINTIDQTFRLPLKNGQEGIFADGVKGNGMTLGLTNGSSYGGLYSNDSSAGVSGSRAGMYGTPVSTTVSPSGAALNGRIGVTTDATKSGLVVDKTIPSGWKLYYYVGDTVQDASLINAGAVLGQLSNKADVDLSNLSNGLTNTICTTTPTTISTASSARPAVVVENYVNGNNWYRIWSDGWIEQGGVKSGGSGTINLLKPYTTTGYSVNMTPTRGDASYSTTAWYIQRSLDSFTMGATPTYTAAVSWSTAGY